MERCPPSICRNHIHICKMWNLWPYVVIFVRVGRIERYPTQFCICTQRSPVFVSASKLAYIFVHSNVLLTHSACDVWCAQASGLKEMCVKVLLVKHAGKHHDDVHFSIWTLGACAALAIIKHIAPWHFPCISLGPAVIGCWGCYTWGRFTPARGTHLHVNASQTVGILVW